MDSSAREMAVMHDNAYLVSHGRSGDFGLFRPVQPLACRRGDRVVLRGAHGLEIGVVLCPASAGHSRLLVGTALGDILRLTTPADERESERLGQLAQRIFEHARRRTAELELPMSIVDVEVVFSGDHAVVYHLCSHACDVQLLGDDLARAHGVRILMNNLTLPPEMQEAAAGCGKPDCGKNDGGCSSCSTGNGCSSCAAGAPKEDVAAVLASSRRQEDLPRTPLL